MNITRALKELPGRIAPKQQQSQNIRWGKGNGRPRDAKLDATKEEVKTYLDEAVGGLLDLDIYELQRRNELEKLLLAQIKRRRESDEVVDAEEVATAAFNAGKLVKEQCLAIAERVAPLVAAESDMFECKQILLKEINFVLESLSKSIGEMS